MAGTRTKPRRRWRGDLPRAAVTTALLLLLGAAGLTSAVPASASGVANVSSAVSAAPEESPSPSPPLDPTPSPTPTPTPTPSPSPTVTPTPEPTASPDPTPSATTTETPEPTATPVPTATPIPAIPPAVTESTTTLPTVLLALGVLVAAGVLLWLLARREPPRRAIAAGTGAVGNEAAPAVLDAMASLGTAMIDSGYPVGQVRNALDDMARVNGLTAAEAVVFPTSILVSSGDEGAVQTRAVTAGDSTRCSTRSTPWIASPAWRAPAPPARAGCAGSSPG